jgi:hypothetical protein
LRGIDSPPSLAQRGGVNHLVALDLRDHEGGGQDMYITILLNNTLIHYTMGYAQHCDENGTPARPGYSYGLIACMNVRWVGMRA